MFKYQYLYLVCLSSTFSEKKSEPCDELAQCPQFGHLVAAFQDKNNSQVRSSKHSCLEVFCPSQKKLLQWETQVTPELASGHKELSGMGNLTYFLPTIGTLMNIWNSVNYSSASIPFELLGQNLCGASYRYSSESVVSSYYSTSCNQLVCGSVRATDNLLEWY